MESLEAKTTQFLYMQHDEKNRETHCTGAAQ